MLRPSYKCRLFYLQEKDHIKFLNKLTLFLYRQQYISLFFIRASMWSSSSCMCLECIHREASWQCPKQMPDLLWLAVLPKVSSGCLSSWSRPPTSLDGLVLLFTTTQSIALNTPNGPLSGLRMQLHMTAIRCHCHPSIRDCVLD